MTTDSHVIAHLSHDADYRNYIAHVPGDGDVKTFQGSFEEVHHRVVEALNSRLGRGRWMLEYRGSDDIPHMQSSSRRVTVSHTYNGLFQAQGEPDLPLLREASFPGLQRGIDITIRHMGTDPTSVVITYRAENAEDWQL